MIKEFLKLWFTLKIHNFIVTTFFLKTSKFQFRLSSTKECSLASILTKCSLILKPKLNFPSEAVPEKSTESGSIQDFTEDMEDTHQYRGMIEFK